MPVGAPLKHRFLFAAHPTVGHTAALRAIGGRLREQHHDVAFALGVVRLPRWFPQPEAARTAAALPAAIEADGLDVVALKPAWSSLKYAAQIGSRTGLHELGTALQLFTAGLPDQARQIAAAIVARDVDVVVADYLLPAAFLGAALAKKPCIALYHSALPFPAEGAPPFGTIGVLDDEQRRAAEATLRDLGAAYDHRVDLATRALGLPALHSGLLTRPMSTTLNLLATTPALEPGLLPLPGPVLLCGPCLPRARAADVDDPALHAFTAADATRAVARVYVSLGTVFNTQPAIFERLIAGLFHDADHANDVVVSAGASITALAKHARPGLHLFARVPQVALLEQADVVITHGGNNTVQECLRAGRPMIVVPFGGDQRANARRVERLGVGVVLMPDRLTPAAIAAAVRAVRRPDVVAKSRAIADDLVDVDGADVAATAILRTVAGIA